MSQYAATIEDIRDAANRIRGVAHRTPVMTNKALDTASGKSLFLKCENLQKVGAFKFRGALNAVSRLTDEHADRGVVTHSSGNHAQALALAARSRGIPAYIVMPISAPEIKRRAVEGYGGKIFECEANLHAREETAKRVVKETGGTFIHPYDHPDIIAGQGTTALELMEQTPDLDAIIAPIGGGGLVSGISIALAALQPKTRMFAAEPAGADDAARSLASGHLTKQNSPDTIADGLLTSLGDLTWPIVRDHVEHIITVSEKQITEAMRLVWERTKLIIEPSSAVAVAATLDDTFKALKNIKRVGVIISGGNVNLDQLPW